MKMTRVIYGLTVLALVAGGARAQTTETAPATDMNMMDMTMDPSMDMEMTNSDRNFAMKANMSSNFEIAAANMALSMGQSEAVKAYAQRMIQDHTMMKVEVQAAMNRGDLNTNPVYELSDEVTPMQQMMLDRLANASENFDSVYKMHMILSHQNAMAMNERFLLNPFATPAMQQVASVALPIITMHLEMAEELPEM